MSRCNTLPQTDVEAVLGGAGKCLHAVAIIFTATFSQVIIIILGRYSSYNMKHIVLGVLTPEFAERHLIASRREDALETRKGLGRKM